MGRLLNGISGGSGFAVSEFHIVQVSQRIAIPLVHCRRSLSACLPLLVPLAAPLCAFAAHPVRLVLTVVVDAVQHARGQRHPARKLQGGGVEGNG